LWMSRSSRRLAATRRSRHDTASSRYKGASGIRLYRHAHWDGRVGPCWFRRCCGRTPSPATCLYSAGAEPISSRSYSGPGRAYVCSRSASNKASSFGRQTSLPFS
jgi:hypothetical protein